MSTLALREIERMSPKQRSRMPKGNVTRRVVRVNPLLRAIGLGLAVALAYWSAVALFAGLYQTSRLPEGEFVEPMRPALLFALSVISCGILALPLFQESAGPELKAFCFCTIAFLIGLTVGRYLGFVNVNPAHPVAAVFEEALHPLRH